MLVASMASMLKLKLRDGTTEHVPLADETIPEDELDAFVQRRGRFEGEWLEVQGVEGAKYLRYDQVVSVEAIAMRRPSATFS